jgi:hypothetical protein
MLNQWLWITICYAELVVVNVVNYAVSVVWNHDVVLLTMVRYAEQVWIMINYIVLVVVNHRELCRTSGCETW